MNSIEEDFLKVIDSFYEGEFNVALAETLAGKAERFVFWLTAEYSDTFDRNEDGVGNVCWEDCNKGITYTLDELYNFFINNVDNK